MRGRTAAGLHFDSGLHAAAQKYYLSALRASATVGDPEIGANVLAFISIQTYSVGDPHDAVGLVETAQDQVRHRTTRWSERSCTPAPPAPGPKPRTGGAPEVLVIFDGELGSAARKAIDPGYKASRPEETPLPIKSLPDIKRGLDAIGLPWIEIDEHEADDVIASAARHAECQRCLVLSRDRDFYQLLSDRVHVLNTARLAGQRIITPEEVTRRFRVTPDQWCDRSALVGDTSDNIPGVRGVGTTTAARLEPLDTLARQVVATRHGHAAIGDPGTSPWLFPGGHPGRPISAFRMAERLRQLGIHAGQARSAALFQLATELPAAVLGRMLGIHIAVAVAWQRACAGDWTSYAADVSRRRNQEPHR